MRSLHVLSLVQSLLLLSKSVSSTDNYGTCHESKPMKKVEGEKIVLNAMTTSNFMHGGTEEDVSFHALIHKQWKHSGPDYEQTMEEAMKNKITFKQDGTLSHEGMKEYFGHITAKDKIFLVVHGWLDKVDSEHKIDGVPWPIAVGADWRFYGKGTRRHVFLVDYRVQSNINYISAANSSIFLVANAIKHLVDYLASLFGFEPKTTEKANYLHQIHAAGHSLGGQVLGTFAHVLGLAENGATIFVIYGIDVAGVLFSWSLFADRSHNFHHLSDIHAHRVILLHTEWKTKGMKYAVGHFDFYANGRSLQPGCDEEVDGEEQDPDSCSHQRGTNYFKASLKLYNENDQRFIGFQCSDKPLYGADKYVLCDPKKTAVYGIHHQDFTATLVSGTVRIYYLPVAACKPYNSIQNKMTMPMPTCKVVAETTHWIPSFHPTILMYPLFEFPSDDEAQTKLVLF